MGESVENVYKDVNKLLNSFRQFQSHGETSMTNLIQEIENIQEEYKNLSEDRQITDLQRENLKENVLNKVKVMLNQFSTEHRDMHAPVSRVGRSIEKNFIADYNYSSTQEVPFSSGNLPSLLNKAIMGHFLRQGRSSMAQALISEAKLDVEPMDQAPYTQMNQILGALKNRNLIPALEWAIEQRPKLRSYRFEFELHRMKFIQLLQSDCDCTALIRYSQTYMPMYCDKYSKEIQVLMGAIAWRAKGLENSPYSHLLNEDRNWKTVCDLFMKEACYLIGVSVDSPLSMSFNAGCIALPALININQAIVQQHPGGENRWSDRDELPIEIDVNCKNYYHSVFACPILRQQSTESNPPMRLTCGHVISRDALHKLTNGTKLKCPYCPVEQNPNDAKQIFF